MGSRCFFCCPHFLLVFGFGASRQFPGAPLSLRTFAGLEFVLEWSCGSDVEDELVPELDDNPLENNKHDINSLAKKNPLPILGQMWLLTTAHSMNNRALRRFCLTTGQQACLRVFAPSRRDQDLERKLVLPRIYQIVEHIVCERAVFSAQP